MNVTPNQDQKTAMNNAQFTPIFFERPRPKPYDTRNNPFSIYNILRDPYIDVDEYELESI